MTQLKKTVVSVFVSLSMFHCSSEINGFDSDEGSQNTAEEDAQVCDEEAGLTFRQRPSRPDMFLALDKSGSMNSSLASVGASKMEIMANAIADVVAENHALPFGLIRFPRSNCRLNALDVSPQEPDNGNLLRIVGQTSGGGSTPIAGVIAQLRTTYFETLSEDAKNPDGQYVLLATDGLESCDGDPVAEIGLLQDLGIKTYVLGFGQGDSEVESLQEMADAGGTTQYYLANTPDELNNAFDNILGEVTELSCVFDLSNEPSDADEITIDIEGRDIQQSSENGWTYDASENQVELHGSACETLKNAGVDSVEVGLGCVKVVIE